MDEHMNPKLIQLSKDITEDGSPTQLIPASPQAPADQLLVQLEIEKTGWELNLELAFINDLAQPQSKIENVDFLQFYVQLPFICQPDRIIDVVRFVTLSNNTLPLIGFGCLESQGMVFFRHLRLILDDQVRSDEVIETIFSIKYLIETFGQALKDLADGKKTFEQIVAEDIQWA
jgi:hypothetical protein